tara:strand:- start:831 stop:1718 length:888 start_codon:yes stop_codon:yes gene_type:complete
MSSVSVLVEAKREYMEQLSILICPVMIDVFDAMYQEAHTLSKGRKVLIMFQKLLKDVPEWNETMARQHTINITGRCDWFKGMVAAVFVISVKILSSVRLSNVHKKMPVKIPSDEVFIHTCYKNAAKDLYKNPYVFTENQSEHDRNDILYDRFALSVENTVKELIPVQMILQTYMPSGEEGFTGIEDDDMQDDDVDEVEEYGQPGLETPVDDEMSPMGEELPPTEDLMTDARDHQVEMGEPEPEPEPEEPPAPFQNEFRRISTNPGHPRGAAPQDADDDGDLFPDAAESRTKKLGY